MPAKPKTKKSAPETAASSSTPKTEPAGQPNWPPLTPLADPSDLSLTTVLQDQILTIPNLWTSTLCRKYVSFLSTLPLTTTPGVPKRGNAVRVNDRYQITDRGFASQLWESTALKALVTSNEGDNASPQSSSNNTKLWGGEPLGLNPNIRIYRYSAHQFFDQHYDESNNLTFVTEEGHAVPAKTTWTLLLYLTSPATGCEGGETVFYPEAASRKLRQPEPVVVGLQVGMALLHRHGRECMLHEGREVTRGEKWVVRSDLCVRR